MYFWKGKVTQIVPAWWYTWNPCRTHYHLCQIWEGHTHTLDLFPYHTTRVNGWVSVWISPMITYYKLSPLRLVMTEFWKKKCCSQGLSPPPPEIGQLIQFHFWFACLLKWMLFFICISIIGSIQHRSWLFVHAHKLLPCFDYICPWGHNGQAENNLKFILFKVYVLFFCPCSWWHPLGSSMFRIYWGEEQFCCCYGTRT